jgi:hypothetical protein
MSLNFKHPSRRRCRWSCSGCNRLRVESVAVSVFGDDPYTCENCPVESANCGIAGVVGRNVNGPVVGGGFVLAFDVVASGCVVGVGDDLVGLDDVVVVVVSGRVGGG